MIYLRNNTCTPLRVAASIYGVKAIWDDKDCVIPEDEKYDLVISFISGYKFIFYC